MLFHRRQREELGVGRGGQRTTVRGTPAAAWVALLINGAVLRISHQRVREMRPQRLEVLFGSASHCPYASGPLGHTLVALHRHLRHSLIGREA